MPLSMIISLVGPIVAKVLTSLWDRIWNHGMSTLTGTTIGVSVIGLLESMGCNLNLGNEATIGLIAALPGLIGTDPGKIAPTLIQAAQDRVDQAKRSAQVLADAQAAQDIAK